MIMKDREKTLPRLLKSILPIVDCYYVLDTGSVDNSIQIIKDFFDQHNISGEIHVNTDCVEIIEGESCFIYGKARNEALKLLIGKADYGFSIDSDEELILGSNFSRKALEYQLNQHDSGDVIMISGISFTRKAFFRINKSFRWHGKIHETLGCDEPMRTCNIENLSVLVRNSATDAQINKYKKYALVLKKDFDETNSTRSCYYLADSYKGQGEWEKAIEYYRKRIELDGYQEERYYSQFMIGMLYRDHGKPYQETLVEFLKCSELDSLRGDHLLDAIIVLQNNGLWHNAYLYSRSAVQRFHNKNPYPERVLFIHGDVYSHRLLEIHLKNCQVLGITDDVTLLSDTIGIDDILNSIPSGWKQNKSLANWLVQKINPRITVELGVDYGYSLLCLAEKNDGRVIGIDHFKGDKFTGIRNTYDFVNNAVKVLSKQHKIKNVTIMQSDTNDALKSWNKNHKIDILHIDSLATYESVRNDFEKWLTYVKDSGVILIHDTIVHEGVRKYFSEISLPKFELKNSSGLGVISKNEKLIKEIAEKFSMSDVVVKPTPKVEKEKITIAYVDHNRSVHNKFLEPSLLSLIGINENVNVILIDDSRSPATNYNIMLSEAKTKYVLFVHQDVTFGTNFLDNIFDTISQVPDFGALGIVGIKDGVYYWSNDKSIHEVDTLDSCSILVNKEHGLFFDDKTFDEFHMYVEDYCCQVRNKLKLKCYTLLTNASEAKKGDVYNRETNYAQHHSATMNVRGYSWGRYGEFLQKMKLKYAKKVGIGFTTRNRSEIFNKCIDNFINTTTLKNYKIVVVDDNSNEEQASQNEFISTKMSAEYIHNKNNVGVAASKNICLDKLSNCDYIFLFDDDIYPKKIGWDTFIIVCHKASGVNHFQYIDKRFYHCKHVDHEFGDFVVKSWDAPAGAMLFLTKEVLNAVGGINLLYAKYGHEHKGYSCRINNHDSFLNKNLGSFLSIDGLEEYFYSYDFENKDTPSSISLIEKEKHVNKNQHILDKEVNSKEYCLFKNVGDEGKIEVDVCIISYAKTPELQSVTKRGIDTLLLSEDERQIKFNVFVVESNRDVNYNEYGSVTTIHPDIDFGYHKYLNIAVREGNAPYVVLCNNDLSYNKGWATEIIKQMEINPEILSASPFCPGVNDLLLNSNDVVYGTTIRKELAGWCFFVQRKIFETIGEFDEQFTFWYADNDYSMTLKKYNVTHALVTKSIVNHHEKNLGKTGDAILNDVEKNNLTYGQYQVFKNKWGEQ